MYENKIKYPGHLVDAILTSKEQLAESREPEFREVAKDFEEISLNVGEQKIIMAIVEVYGEQEKNEEILDKGVSITFYRLYQKMKLKQDDRGRFGSKATKEVLNHLHGLTQKKFTIIFKKFKRHENGRSIYDAIILPHRPLIEIAYSISDITEQELMEGDVEHKADKIYIRLQKVLWNKSYYMLLESNFFPRLRSILEQQGRRISKYHHNFALWILKHRQHSNNMEINVDKLAVRLKIPFDSAHITRARDIVRTLYYDFKVLGYISEFKIDVLAKQGRTKDLILFSGVNGL